VERSPFGSPNLVPLEPTLQPQELQHQNRKDGSLKQHIKRKR
jgi:hypothetical protein